MRLFVAFSLPNELSSAIDAQLATLRDQLPEARWVPAANLHLTVQFLGERSESDAGALGPVLREVFSRHEPLTLDVTAGGAFPARRPRVVWIGLEGPSRLNRLQQEVARATGESQVRGRPRPFRPHVTLARCRNDWRLADVERVREALAPLAGRSFDVTEGTLYVSELTPNGARYQIREAFPFRGV